MEARCVTVIGGANTDICGRPDRALVRHDSAPGRVSVRHGGVGRNIACDLARLGLRTRFVTALGDDGLGASLRESCLRCGVDMSLSLTIGGARSPVYLYLSDERGEMDSAVADMETAERLTPAALRGLLGEINASDAVVIDGNLPAETIAFLCEKLRVPIVADPVSTAKAPRFAPVLDCLAAIKPNLMEAQTLTGKKNAEDCAEALLKAGVGSVYLSLGAGGLLAAAGEERILLPGEKAKLVSATGAGDAATAAVAWALVQGLDLASAARAAVVAGAITVESEEADSPLLRADRLL
ncbi:MAG: bifunctional hydroxymethylpyrimidine kinase/phosphomethylpyrimidine kinase [Oscillospiraceae bacterium]|nr:bifunctional hydroxymethylpyrimidine kinase/phosphomethylpyrimidine kinase [Oscillospiraceae bacterium]